MAKPTSSPRSRWATRSKKWRRQSLRCAAIGALFGGSAHAQSTTWSGPFTSGTWSDPTRWTNGVPTSLIDAIMPAASSFNISFTADAYASDLYLSSNSLVSVLLGTHALNAATLSASVEPGGFVNFFQQGGTLNVSGNGSFGVGTTASAYAQITNGVMAIGGDALIGDLGGIANLVVTTASFDAGSVELGAAGGIGTITLFNGANLLVTNDANIGATASGIAGSGTLNVGSGAAGTASGTTKVWNGGTLIISGGSFTTHSLDLASAGGFTFTSGTLIVSGGSMSPKLGTVPVTYANSTTVNEVNSFEINGSASTPSAFKLTGGGTLYSAANNLFVGHAGKRGILTVDGSNSYFNLSNGSLSVGMSDPGAVQSVGTLLVSNGGSASAWHAVSIGIDGGIATATIDGSNSQLWASDGSLSVGTYGYSSGSNFTRSFGTLLVTNGGQAAGFLDTAVGAYGGKGVATVSGANSELRSSDGQLEIGEFGVLTTSLVPGAGTLNIAAGGSAWSYYDTIVGYAAGTGFVSIDGAGSKLTTFFGGLDVGYLEGVVGSSYFAGIGTLQLTNGAGANSNSSAYVGIAGGKGIITVNASTLTVGDAIIAGAYTGNSAGLGTINITNGGTVTSSSAELGIFGGTATITLTGAGSGWTNAEFLYIGNDGSGSASANGTGSLTLSNNATLSNGGMLKVYSGGNLIVNSGASVVTQYLDLSSAASFNFTGGTVTVSGGQFIPKLTTFTVFGDSNGTSYSHSMQINGGASSAATLNLSGGATLSSTASQTFIGHSGLIGALNIDGSGTHWDLPGGAIAIGTGRNSGDTVSGQGTLAITNGGWVSDSGNTWIGWHGGLGAATVDGPGSKLDTTNALLGIGESGFADSDGTDFPRSHGTLILSNGGEASSHTITRIGDQAGIGYVSVNNATLNVGSILYVGIGQNGAMTLLPGIGTLLVSNGGDVNSAGGAIGSGGGVGTVSLSGTGSTWTNTTDLNIGNDSTGSAAGTGTVALSNNAALNNTGTVRVFSGGKLFVSTGATISTATLNLSSAGSFNFSDGTVTTGTLITTGNLAKFGWTGGTLEISNGDLTIGTVSAGTAGPVGTFLTLGAGKNLRVSKVGSTITVPASGSLNVTGGSVYARSLDAGSANAFTFTGGTIILDGGTGNRFSGDLGIAGDMELTGGAQGSFDFASVAGTDSSLIVTGSNSLATVHESLFIGGFNSGTLEALDGAQVNASQIIVATGTSSTGTVIVDGAGVTAGYFAIGYSTDGNTGGGHLNVTNGGHITSGGAAIGAPYSQKGCFVTLSGTNTSWTNSTDITIGTVATLSIANGAALNSAQSLTTLEGGTILYGAGTLSTGTLTVRGGHVLLGPGHDKVLQTKAVSISSGGIVDLNDNSMVVDYTGDSPLTNIESLIQSGYAGGLWNGSGIVSSAAALAPTKMALGLGEASTVFGPSGGTFQGVPVDSSAVLVKYTYSGDANLDGQVNRQDLLALAQHWGQSDGLWTDGDFNYDGVVNVADLALLAQNWQAGVGSPLAPSLAPLLASLNLPDINVPEPSSIGCFGAVFFGILSCRRRCPLVVGGR